MSPEPIVINGETMYAQATMEGPDGKTLTVVADTPPEIDGGEPEPEAGG